MAKPAPGWFTLQKRKRLLLIFVVIYFSIAIFFCFRGTLDTCDSRRDNVASSAAVDMDMARNLSSDGNLEKNPFDFMRSKLVLLVSHELSLSVVDDPELDVVTEDILTLSVNSVPGDAGESSVVG